MSKNKRLREKVYLPETLPGYRGQQSIDELMKSFEVNDEKPKQNEKGKQKKGVKPKKEDGEEDKGGCCKGCGLGKSDEGK